MKNEIVYEIDFGSESFGKIEKINEKYQCYETPLYGGEYSLVGEPFDNLEDAKKYLNSLG